MSTTLQNITDRAVAWSVANGGASLVSDLPEIINRVAADERSLFDLAAETNSYYYAVEQSVTSSAGSSARTISTTGLVTFTVAPGNTLPLTWTGSYYKRVRFLNDALETERIVVDLWEARTVELIEVL